MSRHRGLKFWTTHVEALDASGLSAKRYAVEHDLCYASILNWRRRLRAEGSGFEEVEVTDAEVASSKSFVIDLESLSQRKLCVLVMALAATE